MTFELLKLEDYGISYPVFRLRLPKELHFWDDAFTLYLTLGSAFKLENFNSTKFYPSAPECFSSGWSTVFSCETKEEMEEYVEELRLITELKK